MAWICGTILSTAEKIDMSKDCANSLKEKCVPSLSNLLEV